MISKIIEIRKDEKKKYKIYVGNVKNLYNG